MTSKKKLLLVQPENRVIHRFRRMQLNNFCQVTMPYLAGFVDEEQYEITLVDEYNEKIPYDKCFDLVAVTVNTANAPHCYEMSRIFREKGAYVIFGGPHATLLPEEAGAHCDTVLVGEGEVIWPQFLHDFYTGSAHGLYRSETVPELRLLPRPRWDLLKKRASLMKGAVFATRGCPHRCRYCNLKQIYHDCFRVRPVNEVIAEIAAMKSRHFVFWDDNFFADAAFARSLLHALAPLHKKWAAQATLADCADEELLRAAKEAGCLYLFVGLESFSDSALQDAGKPINRTADYKAIVEKLHRHGILIQAGIIFGFDSDGPDVFEKTLRACEEIGIDGVTVSILTPLPGTPVFEEFKREGRLITKSWNLYDGKTAVAFEPRYMTPRRLYDGYMAFRRRFYSPLSFLRRMRVSRTHIFYNLLVSIGYRLSIR